MVLSKPDILSYLDNRRLRFDPAVSVDRVAQVSVDLLLGRKFSTYRDRPAYLAAITIDPSLWTSTDLWEHIETDMFRLPPGGFVLAQTLERVSIPNDLVGLVEGRSSWARVGISIHVTAPKIDPGWDGTITLEMFNFGKMTVELRAGIDQPAQLMLLQVSTPLEQKDLYGQAPGDQFFGQSTPIPHKK